MIKLPKDMVGGFECLDYQIPWQTPESIYKEDEELRKDDVVLEIGSGGSTLFFAKRCRLVISIETNPEWAYKVREKLMENKLDNVAHIVRATEEEILSQIKQMETAKVTVLSIDPEGNFNRSKILSAFLEKKDYKSLRMLILDNYGHDGIFPDHHDKLVIDSPRWGVFTYDHPNWAGCGTRIYIKNK